MKSAIAMLLVLILAGVSAVANPYSSDSLIVHEWGTFTSLQDEKGRALPGVNSDDEPLPPFTHSLDSELIIGSLNFSKGIPRAHPQVTMRLETPVLYFHPASGTTPPKLDVTVGFMGGWLTQFYPDAAAIAPGLQKHRLSPTTLGRLTWKDLIVGGDAAGPETDMRAWTAPREVSAASVTTAKGESERFLFYRGVADLNAPIRVRQDGSDLRIHSQLDKLFFEGQRLHIPQIWLADFRTDGTCAFRILEGIDVTTDASKSLASTRGHFEQGEYSTSNRSTLRSQMREALVKDGLYEDEAEALLNTWDASYFRSAGIRLFFLVPQAWTDQYLPLTISHPARIVRTMVGRIELVSPIQRALAARLARTSDPEIQQQLFRDLGRFRHALILDEQRHSPTSLLERFIRDNSLDAFQPH